MSTDIEKRVELVATESLAGYKAISDLVTTAGVVRRRGDAYGIFPSIYVEGYNFMEFGLHTGNYRGGLRIGCMSYVDDDLDADQAKAVLGAVRQWAQQVDLVDLLNKTDAARAAISEAWFFAAQIDENAAYSEDPDLTGKVNTFILEVMIVMMPSRPTE